MFGEENIYQYIQKYDLILLMKTISFPFDTFITYLLAILFYMTKVLTGTEIIFIQLCVTFGTIIKMIIKRKRPYKKYSYINNYSFKKHNSETGKYSFPSGHTVLSTIVSLIMIKKYGYTIFYIVPFLVMMSRVYLGVHYISDVICGYLYSLIFFKLFGNYSKI